MQPALHVLPHTHWDREWFVPSGFTREWLVPFFEALFDRFTEDPDYRFTLDGQSILIEDYLSQVEPQRGEESLRRIETLVREGRLTVGPYYQQPDWQLVSGEALLRNLLIGCDDTAPFGAGRPVGWLMDNFGQIAQCVQIHTEFDISGLFAWRGFDLLPDRVRSDLWWESPDGSRLPVVYLLDSYRNGMRLLTRPDIVPQRLAAASDRIAPFSDDGHILLMNGYDQEMDPERPGRIATELELSVTSPAEYLALKQQQPATDRPVVRGSQYSGRFISVFPGILSARNYLKVANDLAQAMQERYVEPMVALLALTGGAAAGALIEQLRDESTLLWRLLLQNHPHDTICGVSSDPIHEEAELRLIEIEQRQARVIAQVVQQLGIAAIDPAATDRSQAEATPQRYAVFNPSPYPRRAMIDGRWSEPIAPLGLGWAEPQQIADTEATVTVQQREQTLQLGNDKIVVTVSADGTIALGPRRDAQAAVRLTWRDTGDAGDTYNFDQPAQDAPQAVKLHDGAFTVVSETTDRVVIELTGSFRLPEGLDASRTRRAASETDNSATLRVELRTTEAFMRAAIVLDNRSRDHRLQLVVAATGRTDAGLRVLNQFGWEDPARHRESLTDYREDQLPAGVRRLMLGAREPEPPRFVPNDRAFAVGSDSGAALVIHRGLHELEPLGDGSVAATVLRSVGWLARGDLSSRTGDAGPEIFTPDAQCRRRIALPFYVAALESLDASQRAWTAQLVEAALHPVIAVGRASASVESPPQIETVLPAGLIPRAVGSDGTTGGSTVMLSALKVREDGAGAVMRLFNPTGRPAALQWNTPVAAMSAAERPRSSSQRPESLHEIDPYRIYTVALPFTAGAAALRSHRDRTALQRFAATRDGALPYLRFDAVPRSIAADRWQILAPTIAVTTAAPEHSADTEYLRATLQAEQSRLRRLQSALKTAQTAVQKIDASGDAVLLPENAAVLSRVSTLQRQILEAELSVLFTQRLCGGADRRVLYQRTREIALQLNHARVAKRADDYLVALSGT